MLYVVHVVCIGRPVRTVCAVAAAEPALASLRFERKAQARSSVFAFLQASLIGGHIGDVYNQRTARDVEAVH